MAGLTALVRTIDLGVDARTPLTTAQITTIAAWRDRLEDVTTATCRGEAVRLARRVRTLDADLVTNRGSGLVTHQSAPEGRHSRGHVLPAPGRVRSSGGAERTGADRA